MQEITQQHRALCASLDRVLFLWRSLVVAVDGRDQGGKTTIASFIAWQYSIPVVYSDFYLIENEGPIRYNYAAISALIAQRHKRNKPIIVEGIKILETLQAVQCKADFLLVTVNASCDGSIGEEITQYQERFRPEENAHFVFRWSEHG